MRTSSKKRAFTLTELLVVVVVIGVLSAVVLPKFSKVIETRRTTEAEELMGAIRTEQEKRCALDKNYLTSLTEMTDIVKSDNTKNYTLTLASTGVNASRKDKYKYTLSIPSYADGRICCSGADCDKLNKNYPKCDDFTPEASPAACAGEVPSEPEPTPECTNGETRGSETCNGCGTRTTQKCVSGKWTNSPGACSKTVEECNPEPDLKPEPRCSDEHREGEPATGFAFVGDLPVLSRSAALTDTSSLEIIDGNFPVSACPFHECATTSYYWHCGADTDYKWEKKKETKCEPKPSQTKPCEDKGGRKASGEQTATYTCSSSGWSLSGWDTSACRYSCDPATKPQEDPTKKMKCNACGESVIQYQCDEKTGDWKEIGGPCSKTPEECGYLCGTSNAQCTPGAHDYKSGKKCAIGKGHPDNLVTRYGSDCTLDGGYMCLMKANTVPDLATDIDEGNSNSNRECECPTVWWSGRYCDERCSWVEESCAPSGGGGGGGGGRLGGGCSTSMEVVSMWQDTSGMVHESWAYVTRCDDGGGLW